MFDWLTGRKTYILAALQAIATAAYTVGSLDQQTYLLLAQVFGWPAVGSVAHKVWRESR